MSNLPSRHGSEKTPWYILILMGLGIIVRCLHLIFISWNAPFHLGGLFYEFSRQILLNHFALPAVIPFYSPGGIPFLYPPLPFYLQAVIMYVFSPPRFITVNLLPPLLAAFSLPVFYWMVKQATGDHFMRAASLAAFALMPSGFVNQIEGAGLAEACGTLALLGYLGWLFRFEKSPRLVPALWAGFMLGLCVLSSPGSAYGGIIASIIFFIRVVWQGVKKLSLKGVPWLLLTGLVGLVVSSPYWLNIIIRQEQGIILNTFLTQHEDGGLLYQIRYLITFKPADMITLLSDEGIYGFLFDWLVLAGIIWAVLNRRISQVILFFSLWLIPREGVWLVAIPAALLAGEGFIQVVWPLFKKAFLAHAAGVRPPLAPGVLGLIMVLILIASPLFVVHDLINQEQFKLSTSEVTDLDSARSSLPDDATVLVAGNGSLREWAPALLQREVLNCEFGLEWKPIVLQKVQLINEALAENDLPAAIQVIQNNFADTNLWLIGVPDQITSLAASASPGIQVIIQSRTPELIFASIETK